MCESVSAFPRGHRAGVGSEAEMEGGMEGERSSLVNEGFAPNKLL